MAEDKKAGAARKKTPERSCIGCRGTKSKMELIRVVRLPDGTVTVDGPKGKLNGRGAYVCPTVECFDLAIQKRAFDHVLKVKLTPEAVNTIKDGFIQRLLPLR